MGRLLVAFCLLALGFPVKDAPHCPQNFACGKFSPPQLGQRFCRATPHSIQNFTPSGFSKPQLAQRMPSLYSFGQSGTRNTLPPCQAAICCCRLRLCFTPSTYCAPTYTVGSNSAPLRRRNVDSATCNSFQINAVEIVSNGVEKGVGSSLLLGNGYTFFFPFLLHSLSQFNSSSNAWASCKSFVSKPSVNQL